jgi:predicted N-acetyltransferase YhbS
LFKGKNMTKANNILIRKAVADDLEAILAVAHAAFDGDPSIITLISDLLDDPSAQPTLSLVALHNQHIVGHILFSYAKLGPHPLLATAILAPLAVAPTVQNQGIGGQLIQAGLEILAQDGFSLVFVLGYPEYYSRFGFQTAGVLGFEASYPILEKNADAWMVQALQPNLLGKVSGKVLCAEKLDNPVYWCE